MDIRRLSPESDVELYREAFAWDVDAPRWYAQMDSVFRPDSFDECLSLATHDDQVDVGVFEDGLIGLITISRRGPGLYEAHLSAKRGTDLNLLAEAGYQVKEQLFGLGMKRGFVWVAKKNRPVRRLCQLIGFTPDGFTMLRGRYHDKPIEWLHMAV
jgi:hypothetical protein